MNCQSLGARQTAPGFRCRRFWHRVGVWLLRDHAERVRRGAYTTESAQDAPVSGPVGIINTGALNIRSGPGIQYSSLGVLAGGTETRIIGRTRDWSWWLLETPLGNGWANRIYVIVRGSTSNVPYVAPGEAVPPSDGTEGGESPEPAVALPLAIVNTGALHVRSGPNSTFSSLGSVYAGAKLSIIGQSPDRGWWLVHSAYGDGWISKAFRIPLAIRAACRSSTDTNVGENQDAGT